MRARNLSVDILTTRRFKIISNHQLYHLHFNSCFPGESLTAFPAGFTSSTHSGRECFGKSGTGFFGCPARHSTNSVNTLKQTQSTDPKPGKITDWPHLIFIHHQSDCKSG